MHCVDWHAQWVNLFHPASFLLSSLDHPQPFEIEPSTAVAGDDITLTCRGTRYLYDRLNWYDPLGHMVPKGETTFQIEPYAISLSIKLPNVSRNHTLGYECQALNMNSNKVVNTTSVLTIDGELQLKYYIYLLNEFIIFYTYIKLILCNNTYCSNENGSFCFLIIDRAIVKCAELSWE